jgi:hypothetical protein
MSTTPPAAPSISPQAPTATGPRASGRERKKARPHEEVSEEGRKWKKHRDESVESCDDDDTCPVCGEEVTSDGLCCDRENCEHGGRWVHSGCQKARPDTPAWFYQLCCSSCIEERKEGDNAARSKVLDEYEESALMDQPFVDNVKLAQSLELPFRSTEITQLWANASSEDACTDAKTTPHKTAAKKIVQLLLGRLAIDQEARGDGPKEVVDTWEKCSACFGVADDDLSSLAAPGNLTPLMKGRLHQCLCYATMLQCLESSAWLPLMQNNCISLKVIGEKIAFLPIVHAMVANMRVELVSVEHLRELEGVDYTNYIKIHKEHKTHYVTILAPFTFIW